MSDAPMTILVKDAIDALINAKITLSGMGSDMAVEAVFDDVNFALQVLCKLRPGNTLYCNHKQCLR